jgi:[acyl-carrier-protein] S-malonyltransferase
MSAGTKSRGLEVSGHSVVATVAGRPILEGDVDDREERLRNSRSASALPQPGTSEGRQLRRWLVQLMVTERVVVAEADALGVTDADAPEEWELLPDNVARMELGSVAAAVLQQPLARAVFVHVTAPVSVSDADVADYHVRNPSRFGVATAPDGGWRRRASVPLAEVRPTVAAHLLAAARRRAFRRWLDQRSGELVELAPGYEHPGDPRQPDNTHRH